MEKNRNQVEMYAGWSHSTAWKIHLVFMLAWREQWQKLEDILQKFSLKTRMNLHLLLHLHIYLYIILQEHSLFFQPGYLVLARHHHYVWWLFSPFHSSDRDNDYLNRRMREDKKREKGKQLQHYFITHEFPLSFVGGDQAFKPWSSCVLPLHMGTKDLKGQNFYLKKY